MFSSVRQAMPFAKVLAFVLVVALVVVSADARVYKGTMKTKNDWQYVAKFCYSGVPSEVIGIINWNIPSPSTPNRTLLLYWDQPNTNAQGSWKHVYQNNKITCAQKTALNATARGGQFNLHNNPTGHHQIGNHYPHYWWAVIADCGAQTQQLSYYIEFLQSGGSQLSCDEKGTCSLEPNKTILFSPFFQAPFFVFGHSLFRTDNFSIY